MDELRGRGNIRFLEIPVALLVVEMNGHREAFPERGISHTRHYVMMCRSERAGL